MEIGEVCIKCYLAISQAMALTVKNEPRRITNAYKEKTIEKDRGKESGKASEKGCEARKEKVKYIHAPHEFFTH